MPKLVLKSVWYCFVLLACSGSTESPCAPEDDECLAGASVSLLQVSHNVQTHQVPAATVAIDGPAPEAPLVPKFNKDTMPPVSTTNKCVMNLTFQYFGLFTALAIVRTLMSFKFDLVGVQRIIETGCTTVTYAPMLCVLFLGARMRAIQLTQGETEKYELPQPFVKQAMVLCSFAVLLQVLFVLLVGMMSGISNVVTDAEGNLDVSQMKDQNPLAVNVLTVARYVVMAMLYGGFSTVVYGIFAMEGPKDFWEAHGGAPPVSPAVHNTILLAFIFFLIYLLVALTKTTFELAPSMRSSQILQKLEASAGAAKMTVNFAPMLAILFIGTRMRALSIDPVNGNPQAYAQKCMYLCTTSVLVQAICGLVLPFAAGAECKRGECEGDVAFVMENKAIGAVMNVVRYACLFALYGGVIAIVYSVFTIQHPDGAAMTPAVSPALKCTIALSIQYFLIYSVLFVCITLKSFVLQSRDVSGIQQLGTVADLLGKAIYIADAARSTVMFAPMLSILCIGCRMRAQQIAVAQDGQVPPGMGPQVWAQQAMQLSTGAIAIQLIMTIVVPILTGVDKPELDVDGNVKMPSNGNKYLAMFVELVRYMNLIFMYIGATVVCVGIIMMTPDTVQPYSHQGLR